MNCITIVHIRGPVSSVVSQLFCWSSDNSCIRGEYSYTHLVFIHSFVLSKEAFYFDGEWIFNIAPDKDCLSVALFLISY